MLTPGIKGHAALRVTTENTAKALGSGELPVLATPAVAALIEKTCWQSIAAELELDQSTGCKKSKEERTDLMAVSEKPILTFTIDFETAKRYREANKMPHQFRRAAWTDLTVEVYL